MQMDLMDELDRRRSNTVKILEYLQDNGEATNTELIKIGGYRYSARIKELRSEGHLIVTTNDGSGVFRYTYLGESEDE